LAREIINQWQASQILYYDRGPQSSYAAEMLTQLERLADADLATQFIQEAMVHDYRSSEGVLLSALCDQFGYPTLAPALTHFIAAQTPAERRASLKATVEIFAMPERIAYAGGTQRDVPGLRGRVARGD
jgi:hypothetical protein